jgi:GTP-binding protein
MFIDRARIKVTAGAGGNGCCSFRREKYVPLGGPNGGDGGKGGDVYFVANARLTSMLDLAHHAHLKAERGEHGQGSDCHGKTGADALVPVPLGTIIRDLRSDEILADLIEEGPRFLAARGGRGGRGNARFMSGTNRAPHFAELGEPGEEREYLLELKVIAEVGIVGLPNAGKSTLLAAISAARPKIDAYPFTTLSPNLGVVQLSDYRTLTVADIPGIIEGAAEGKGLGHDFLRHIERTQVLLFLIDLGDPDPAKTLETLEDELTRHSAAFRDRPRVFALNKADIPENRERFNSLARAFDHPFLISAATGEGVHALLEHLWGIVDKVRREGDAVAIPTVEREYTYEAPFTIQAVGRTFRIKGRRVEQVVRMTNFDNEYAVRHLQDTLKRMGVFKALKRMGADEGQIIAIGDVELEYRPD